MPFKYQPVNIKRIVQLLQDNYKLIGYLPDERLQKQRITWPILFLEKEMGLFVFFREGKPYICNTWFLRDSELIEFDSNKEPILKSGGKSKNETVQVFEKVEDMTFIYGLIFAKPSIECAFIKRMLLVRKDASKSGHGVLTKPYVPNGLSYEALQNSLSQWIGGGELKAINGVMRFANIKSSIFQSKLRGTQGRVLKSAKDGEEAEIDKGGAETRFDGIFDESYIIAPPLYGDTTKEEVEATIKRLSSPSSDNSDQMIGMPRKPKSLLSPEKLKRSLSRPISAPSTPSVELQNTPKPKDILSPPLPSPTLSGSEITPLQSPVSTPISTPFSRNSSLNLISPRDSFWSTRSSEKFSNTSETFSASPLESPRSPLQTGRTIRFSSVLSQHSLASSQEEEKVTGLKGDRAFNFLLDLETKTKERVTKPTIAETKEPKVTAPLSPFSVFKHLIGLIEAPNYLCNGENLLELVHFIRKYPGIIFQILLEPERQIRLANLLIDLDRKMQNFQYNLEEYRLEEHREETVQRNCIQKKCAAILNPLYDKFLSMGEVKTEAKAESMLESKSFFAVSSPLIDFIKKPSEQCHGLELTKGLALLSAVLIRHPQRVLAILSKYPNKSEPGLTPSRLLFDLNEKMKKDPQLGRVGITSLEPLYSNHLKQLITTCVYNTEDLIVCLDIMPKYTHLIWQLLLKDPTLMQPVFCNSLMYIPEQVKSNLVKKYPIFHNTINELFDKILSLEKSTELRFLSSAY